MIGFIIKGVLRDRSRSLFPVLIVASGVMLTVFFYSYMQGGKNNFIETSARYQAGHLKVMTRAYAAEADLIPNDSAIIVVSEVLARLQAGYPEILWKPRIRFSGLLDIPDETGETRAQGPVSGLAVELFSGSQGNRAEVQSEVEILNLKKGLVNGHLPERPGEILIPSGLADRLKIKPGDSVTFITSTMAGALAIADFNVAGIIRFGVTPLDRNLVIADLSDAQSLLDMEDCAGEIFGFFSDFLYSASKASRLARDFNKKTAGEKKAGIFNTGSGQIGSTGTVADKSSGRGTSPDKGSNNGGFVAPNATRLQDENLSDEFQPIMLTLEEQGGLADMLAIYDIYSYVLVAVFVGVMSIVLWNAGLMGSLRRYSEIGLRLAMGETRRHLYFSLLGESLIIGALGSVAGTALGLAISYYLQAYGINAETFTKSSEMMMTNVIKAQVTWVSYLIGFIPGLLATVLGRGIAGLAVFRRRTATLMKEFET